MAMTQPDFGTCWGTPNGLDLSSPSYMASGFLVVAEAILRRWNTGRGQLVDDPNYGESVFDLISDDLGPSDLAYAQQRLAAEAKKDERISRAAVTLTLAADGACTIAAVITTAAGPFRMVVKAANATLQLLEVTS
jgi:hypothetical protein